MKSSSPGKMSHWTKAGYGAAELGLSAIEVMLQLYLLEFYTVVVGLRADWVGYALALAVLWDAVSDPIMGALSDRTRTPWGPRLPYLALGAPVLAGAFVLLYAPPAVASPLAKLGELLFLYIVVNTGMTIIAVPHAALGGELSQDRHERTELFGWRLLCRNGGFLLAVLLPTLLTGGATPDPARLAEGRGAAASLAALVTLAAAAVTVLALRPRARQMQAHARPPRHARKASVLGFFKGLGGVVGNKVFLPLLLAFVVAQIGRTINASLGMYYYKIYLGLTEAQIGVGVLGLFVVVISLSIPFWVWLSRRYGKKWPGLAGALTLGALTTVTYPLLPPGLLWPPMLFASVLGGFTIGAIVLFDSLVADVVDYDELRTGEHREGLYYGCWTMTTKMARAVGLALTGVLLEAIGFNEGAAVQSEEVGRRIAWLFGPGVGVWFLAAAAVFAFMPLTESKHKQVQRLLRRREAKEEARTSPE